MHNLNNYLDDIICSNQHGFRTGRSCTTQLATVKHDILDQIDSGASVHAAVLDFSKAFDLVPHHLLITKMIKHNISPVIIKWVSSFLSDRLQRVVIDGERSGEIQVTSGVPQGSVLGPALFTLFINDIVNSISHSDIRLFADDTLVYRSVCKQEDAEFLQKDLDSLEEWSQQNGMRFNAGKSKIIIFRKSKAVPVLFSSYHLNHVDLDVSDSVKYLGVHLSEFMDFKKQVRNVVSKASGLLGLLRNTLYGAPSHVKLIAYKTLCRPILEYASEVWDPSHSYLSQDLEAVQQKAVRFIANLRGWKVSVSEHRVKLSLETLEKRRQCHRIALFMHIMGNNHLFPTLDSAVTDLRPRRSTRASSNDVLLNSRSCNSSVILNSFLVRTARELRVGGTDE